MTYRNIKVQSPSTRRAWIEIAVNKLRQMWQHNVALHPEGVDRNSNDFETQPTPEVALHPEGVDRNFATGMIVELIKLSPSTRRAWIEIGISSRAQKTVLSPSTRRAWIEIL